MHEIFNHDGEDFSCLMDGRKLSGKIRIEGNDAFFCQNSRCGTSPLNRLGYQYGWVYMRYRTDRTTISYQTKTVTDLICGNIEVDKPLSLDTIAQSKAKELIPNGSDEEIDAFINGYILGYNNKNK